MAETLWRCEAHGSDWYRDWCVNDRLCINCGHPESHHDAGECWTDADGQETWGETACPCWWAEFEEAPGE